MSRTTSTPRPIYSVLGVYDNDPQEIKWLAQFQDPSVEILPHHCINLDLSCLKNGKAIAELRKKSKNLREYVKEIIEERKFTGSDPYPPIIFLGLGFGAVVAMNALLEDHEPILTPMGMVMCSVSSEGTTGKSEEFRMWYKKLTAEAGPGRADIAQTASDMEVAQDKNTDLSDLVSLLYEFDEHCRLERVRFSYVIRDKEASNNTSILKFVLLGELTLGSVTSSPNIFDMDGRTRKPVPSPWRRSSRITLTDLGPKRCFSW